MGIFTLGSVHSFSLIVLAGFLVPSQSCTKYVYRMSSHECFMGICSVNTRIYSSEGPSATPARLIMNRPVSNYIIRFTIYHAASHYYIPSD
ncbi:hypothetical protein V8C42DRAFT_288586 [Trichoderma barbatum]